ncbi:MAG: adenylosuccinate synthetase [Candidatus Korobacteraceae bacterium]
MVIEASDRHREQELGLRERLSSTLCGVGSAVARRVLRGTDVCLARHAAENFPWLKPLLTDVSAEANEAIDLGRKVLVEGTQGFGLSLYHSEQYPKATSRDTTAAGFLSEVGLSPILVTEIVVVLRTFPIRVSGKQAGSFLDETDWKTIQIESGYPHPLDEITSVTKKTRRVGRFDWDLASRAIVANRPTRIAVNGLDYLDYRDLAAQTRAELSAKSVQFLSELDKFRVPVRYFGVGPKLTSVFDYIGCSIRCEVA